MAAPQLVRMADMDAVSNEIYGVKTDLHSLKDQMNQLTAMVTRAQQQIYAGEQQWVHYQPRIEQLIAAIAGGTSSTSAGDKRRLNLTGP